MCCDKLKFHLLHFLMLLQATTSGRARGDGSKFCCRNSHVRNLLHGNKLWASPSTLAPLINTTWTIVTSESSPEGYFYSVAATTSYYYTCTRNTPRDRQANDRLAPPIMAKYNGNTQYRGCPHYVGPVLVQLVGQLSSGGGVADECCAGTGFGLLYHSQLDRMRVRTTGNKFLRATRRYCVDVRYLRWHWPKVAVLRLFLPVGQCGSTKKWMTLRMPCDVPRVTLTVPPLSSRGGVSIFGMSGAPYTSMYVQWRNFANNRPSYNHRTSII